MDMKINAKAVKTLRNKRLWSQEELATACGISLRTIQRLEGEGQASVETLKALAAVFEVEYTYFTDQVETSFEYLNVQLGFAVLLIFVCVAGLLIGLIANGVMPTMVMIIVAIMILLILGVVGALFSSLSTRVTQELVEWQFAFGFHHKSISIEQIKSVKTVRNKWWWGLGIRLTPQGWLYCVSGLDAVALRLLDGHKVRIGTDEPEEFKLAIERAKQSELA